MKHEENLDIMFMLLRPKGLFRIPEKLPSSSEVTPFTSIKFIVLLQGCILGRVSVTRHSEPSNALTHIPPKATSGERYNRFSDQGKPWTKEPHLWPSLKWAPSDPDTYTVATDHQNDHPRDTPGGYPPGGLTGRVLLRGS